MDQKRIMTLMFTEIVLALNGVFALQGTDNRTINMAAHTLGRAWKRAQNAGAQTSIPYPDIQKMDILLRALELLEEMYPDRVPHPAMDELLQLVEEAETEEQRPWNFSTAVAALEDEIN